MGYKIDISPMGQMLLIQNNDIPGVVGKVGSLLGENNVNIAEFILSRKSSGNKAYSIIKIDDSVSSEILNELSSLDEVLEVKQITINE